MKVLVLGATGLLGTHISEYLKKEGEQVIAHGFSKKADINKDLVDLDSCYELLNSVKPDYIINTVALTDVDKCEQYPMKAYELNIKVVENINSCLKAKNCSPIIHVSTDMVYNGQGENEENNAKPQNIYALTKYCAEKEVLLSDGVVLRTNFLWDSSQVEGKTSFNDWIIKSVKEKNDIQFISDVYFSPLHLDTLVKMVYKVLLNPISGIYNLGSKEGFSKSDFARKICDLFELDADYVNDISVDSLSLQAKRPTQMKMKVEKFESTFNVTLPTLDDEIEKLTN